MDSEIEAYPEDTIERTRRKSNQGLNKREVDFQFSLDTGLFHAGFITAATTAGIGPYSPAFGQYIELGFSWETKRGKHMLGFGGYMEIPFIVSYESSVSFTTGFELYITFLAMKKFYFNWLLCFNFKEARHGGGISEQTTSLGAGFSFGWHKIGSRIALDGAVRFFPPFGREEISGQVRQVDDVFNWIMYSYSGDRYINNGTWMFPLMFDFYF
jgi:hypothetical protein